MSRIRCAAVAAAAVLLPVALPSAPRAAAATLSTDPCLVGTWQDGVVTYLGEFHRQLVWMQGLAGAVEVDESSGASTIHYRTSAPAYGTYRGHRLREVIRGRVTAYLSADPSTGQLRFTHKQAQEIRLTFTYRHHRSTFLLDGHLPAETDPYTCDDTQYTVPAGSATRESAPPGGDTTG